MNENVQSSLSWTSCLVEYVFGYPKPVSGEQVSKFRDKHPAKGGLQNHLAGEGWRGEYGKQGTT